MGIKLSESFKFINITALLLFILLIGLFSVYSVSVPPINVKSICGNSRIEGNEQCDLLNLNSYTCESRGYGSGTLKCTRKCTFDTSKCVSKPKCGNGIVESGEQCDKTSLAGKTCRTLGYSRGNLICSALCKFDTTGCVGYTARCGNGIIDGNEQCDGTNLNLQTCQSKGYASGILRCNPSSCTFNTIGCVPARCGNNIAEASEECDGNDLKGKSCQTLVRGFGGGMLVCYPSGFSRQCRFDTSKCTAGTSGSCIDTDGGPFNVDVKGTVTDKYGNQYTDYCYSQTQVNEWRCNPEGTATAVVLDCSAGKTCQNGACTGIQNCGSLNQLCCSGNTCSSGTCQNGICSSVGGLQGGGGSQCNNDGTCTSSETAMDCVTIGGTCIPVCLNDCICSGVGTTASNYICNSKGGQCTSSQRRCNSNIAQLCVNSNWQNQQTCTNGCNQQTGTCNSQNPVCGNSIKEGTEQCDDGVNNGACPKTCSASCTSNSCNNCGNLNQPCCTVIIQCYTGSCQSGICRTSGGNSGSIAFLSPSSVINVQNDLIAGTYAANARLLVSATYDDNVRSTQGASNIVGWCPKLILNTAPFSVFNSWPNGVCTTNDPSFGYIFTSNNLNDFRNPFTFTLSSPDGTITQSFTATFNIPGNFK